MTEVHVNAEGVVDWQNQWTTNRCPSCKTAGTMIFDDPSRHEHWGRCFKCMYFWERQP